MKSAGTKLRSRNQRSGVDIDGRHLRKGATDSIAQFVKEQGAPEYDERIVEAVKGDIDQLWDEFGEKDELYDKALELVLLTGQASASYLQRRLKLGYARAARIIDQLHAAGVLGASKGSKARDVLVGLDDLDRIAGPDHA